ncbi:serine/threonine kinase 16 [Lophium mytilinum]|uniref:Serine/threonine kinase 16 n=1 Tax=Lophium mytilinum TaxID=390894 RepID=A0A6A6Q9X8_9PEZI|nr:serine/threonine kinase 16 [Lophium mytilinum]
MAASAPTSTGESAHLWPPGTVRLEDMTSSAGKDIILEPRPSEDPNDPFNWSTTRKYINFGLVCLYVAMVAEFINASTPTWGPMNKELGYSFEILNDSYAVGCACLALGSVILIPFALKFGRRPLYIFSTALQFGLSIWSAKMETVADLMLINILQCLFGSLAEVIVQMTIADIFFVHQRGRANAIYVWVWLLSSYLGSLIAGFVAKGQGWRWIWWWNAIFFGIALLIVVFGYEETKYAPPIFGMVSETEKSPPSSALKHEEAEFGRKKPDLQTRTGSSQDIDPPKSIEAVENGALPNIDTVIINHSIPLKTYRQKLSIFTTTTPSAGIENNAFLSHMYQPLIILTTIPAVAYAALVYGILVGLGDVMSTTMSTYLVQPPYNFASDQVGLMSLPRVIGVTIGAAIIGPLSDWAVIYFSRRNKGIYDPESRLWCIVPFLLFVPAGALLFSIGLNNHLPWPVIAVGLALYNIGVTPINSVIITYLTDSYRDIIGDALVGVTVVRNSFSTAFIFALTPWEARVGLKWVFVTILLIACAILSLFGVFIRWGKAFRGQFAGRYQYYALRQYKER